jgi:outer-membrane receptor for ferric coprogen and ferric-rhodotorulic acid
VAPLDGRRRTGERADLTLPDGTRVQLNSGTAINVRFDATERLVRLLGGEILVQTAHDSTSLAGANSSRPFVIQTGKDDLAVADGDSLTPQGEQAYIAADDTKTHGFDMEVSGQSAPGWQLQTSYTRTLLEDSSGERLSTQFQPEHQVKLFTTWTPLGLSRLTVGGGVLWQSKIHGTLSVNPTLNDEAPFVDKIYTQDSFAAFNLNANFAFNDRLTLALQLNNAFDKTYRVHAVNHYYGAPRNLYATLKYQF